jgi:hypothetical protein
MKAPKLLFFASTQGALTLVDFCTYVELNKDIFLGVHVANPRGNDDMQVIADMAIIYFC